MLNQNPAVLIICFLRVDSVIDILEKLFENKYSNIYIHLDGPRNEDDARVQINFILAVNEFEAKHNVEIKKIVRK